MDKDLSHRSTAAVDVLDLLGGDVLPLGQLEQVLLPVDELQGPVLRPRERRGGQAGEGVCVCVCVVCVVCVCVCVSTSSIPDMRVRERERDRDMGVRWGK